MTRGKNYMIIFSIIFAGGAFLLFLGALGIVLGPESVFIVIVGGVALFLALLGIIFLIMLYRDVSRRKRLNNL